MDASELKWDFYEDPVDSTVVDGIELELGVALPEDFKTCVRKYHGGRPDNRRFSFLDQKLGEMKSSFAVLLSFNRENSENILRSLELRQDQLPKGIVPFGDDGGGDMICFDYRHTASNPPIVYWHHEREGDESVTFLAKSFSEFLEMLTP
jgi:cell wall assembly regulator SMI1